MLHPPLLAHPTLTDPRTGEPLQPIGTINGRPIWPVLGAAPEDDDDGDQGDEGDDGDQGDDDKPLGPKGQKALEAEKAKRKAATAARLKAEKERDAALAQLRKADKGKKPDAAADADDEVDVEQIRKDATAAAKAEGLRDRVLDKIEAKAGGQLATPEDARLLLAGQVDEFIDDGEIDVEAITAAIADLLKKRPYLSAQGGKKFKGTGDGGARQSATAKPKSLGEAVAARYKTAKP